MALQPVAVLGLDGWVVTPREKMDNLWVHFVEANHSQTTLSRGAAYSFQYILTTFSDDQIGLSNEIQRVLNLYYGAYFATVSSQVSVKPDPQRPGTMVLHIFLVVTDEYGKEYNLAKVSSDIKSKTIRWANLNNYGDENRFNQ